MQHEVLCNLLLKFVPPVLLIQVCFYDVSAESFNLPEQKVTKKTSLLTERLFTVLFFVHKYSEVIYVKY